MNTLLKGIPGTTVQLDDILFMTTDQDDLEKRLDIVVTRMLKFGFRLCADKFTLCIQQVHCLSFIGTKRDDLT